MRQRRETVEHPFATIKARMGAMHFLKTLPRVSGEMALHVLVYNLTRIMNIIGTNPLVAAIRGMKGASSRAFQRTDRPGVAQQRASGRRLTENRRNSSSQARCPAPVVP
jgi:hypothetical protein